MASQFPSDILIPTDVETVDRRPRQSKIAAFVPITLALFGVAAILFGGVSAKQHETASEQQIVDPLTTGSILTLPQRD